MGKHGYRERTLLGCAALLLVGFAFLTYLLWVSPVGRHWRYYGEAEQMVDEVIIPFRNVWLESGESVEAVLQWPAHTDLCQRVMDVPLANNEAVRFEINDGFDIGVSKQGGILWYPK